MPLFDVPCSFCLRVVKHRYFDNIILFFILISSINLILDEPRANPDTSIQQFVYHADYVLAIVFAVEMGLKLIAFGVILHKVSGMPMCTICGLDAPCLESHAVLWWHSSRLSACSRKTIDHCCGVLYDDEFHQCMIVVIFVTTTD